MYYTIFGLLLHSSRPIPGIVEAPDSSHADVFVEWFDGPSAPSDPSQIKHWFDSPVRTEEGVPALRAWKVRAGGSRLVYWNGVEFLIDGRAERVRVFRSLDVPFEEALSLLFDDVLAHLLRWRGMTSLHASAVRIGGGAVAFMGAVGKGKSTTAAAFVQMGYPLITDDLLPLVRKEGRFFVLPAYPQLRLWPQSVKALGHDGRRLPQLVPGREKRRLDLRQNGYSFQQEPVPLAAVYLLGERIDNEAAPYVEAVSQQAGIVALLANKYTKHLLDKEMAASDFDLLTQLAAQIRPRRIVPHADVAYLPQMCEHVLAEVESLPG